MKKFSILCLVFISAYALEYSPDKVISQKCNSFAMPGYTTITGPRFKSFAAKMPPPLFDFNEKTTPITPEFSASNMVPFEVNDTHKTSNSYNPVHVNVADITVSYVRTCYKLDRYFIAPCEKLFYALTCGSIVLLQFDTEYQPIFKYSSLACGAFAFGFNKIHDIVNKKIKREDSYLYDIETRYSDENLQTRNQPFI